MIAFAFLPDYDRPRIANEESLDVILLLDINNERLGRDWDRYNGFADYRLKHSCWRWRRDRRSAVVLSLLITLRSGVINDPLVATVDYEFYFYPLRHCFALFFTCHNAREQWPACCDVTALTLNSHVSNLIFTIFFFFTIIIIIVIKNKIIKSQPISAKFVLFFLK